MFLKAFNLDGLQLVNLYNDIKFEVNLSDNSENYYWYGCYPKEVVTFLQTHLKENDVFVDCGANFGLWTLISAECISNSGRVYSYEPNPELYYRLTRNISYNIFRDRCISFRVGLSSESTTAYLNLHQKHHQMSSLHTKPSVNQIAIELQTLDSCKLGKINGMKVDVEGHELDVIKGAMKTLEKHKPWLVIELNNLFNKIQTISHWKVYEILSEIGYMTNFSTSVKLNPSFCRDIIFFHNTNSQRELFPAFL